MHPEFLCSSMKLTASALPLRYLVRAFENSVVFASYLETILGFDLLDLIGMARDKSFQTELPPVVDIDNKARLGLEL